VTGVGHIISRNRFYNAPANAVYYSGNNHLIEYNEIYNVCNETSDCGALYSGRDWTYQGNVIQYNYLHDINPTNGAAADPGVIGVYLDDCISGVKVHGNCFDRVYWGIEIAGGRDNTISNNCFVDCSYSCVNIENRGASWFSASGLTTLSNLLVAMPYNTAPWSNSYPQLLTYLTNNPTLPEHNAVQMNIGYGPTQLLTNRLPLSAAVTIANNFTNGDPLFVNYATNNFQLQAGSPALNMGFEQIPFDQIGPVKPLRASNLRLMH
jgi:parallel beta-helix repeat protein